MYIFKKKINKKYKKKLLFSKLDKIFSNIYSSRKVSSISKINYNFKNLIKTKNLLNIEKATKVIIKYIFNKKKICIIPDYDCDGITSCVLAIKILKKLGANVYYFIPNRFKYGYGLSIKIIKKLKKNTKLIITVDNGISSFKGIKYANKKNIKIIITDHHLPNKKIPNNCIIVNPNFKKNNSKIKNLSGVGVTFYLLLHLNNKLKKKFLNFKKIKIKNFLDIVAIGTLADIVKLDYNNRILIYNGIRNIKNLGILKLLKFLNKNKKNINCNDIIFYISPLINSTGRIKDPYLSIKFLLTNNKKKLNNIIKSIIKINNTRKKKEKSILFIINNYINKININRYYSLIIYNKKFHEGIIGIISSKIKEKFNLPTIIFTKTKKKKFIKGSGRSIKNINIKNILEKINKSNSKIIKKFGGHSMAIGLTIFKNKLNLFKKKFNNYIKKKNNKYINKKILKIDCYLNVKYFNKKFIILLNKQIWGNNFSEPIFYNFFNIIKQKIINKKHNFLLLKLKNNIYNSIWFNNNKIINFNNKILVFFKIYLNNFNNKIQLILQYIKEINYENF
ncbi:single-stranded-DNA-specific exonuclease RecJ [Candidatus Zinderia insecticola CARI]|uniref:Single-stranded-DNA-specific exonuclease RecJ n=1 Tax=Zinderia insecticola (strain CARI) TaxID=871271 RepID=E0TJ01_ZINIC|nr:single-stranded-DNA-specific exonuclease RecJ [Candidatus Zinderia insecticola CARI]